VLGESYNRGWQASCDGRSLGAPQVIDAFANGWRVGPRCRSASITFRPQRYVELGFVLGALGCFALVLVLLLGLARGRYRRGPDPGAADFPPPPPVRELSGRRALAAGALAGVGLGFVFALRAGVVLGPAVALILWRGVPTRTLLAAAGSLLVGAVPLVYLAFPGHDQGGYDTGFPNQHLAAHWLTVAAITLLGLVLARELRGARART
jgi:hypothetical protein